VIDPKQLLEQVLGAGVADDVRCGGRQVKGKLDSRSGPQAFAGDAPAQPAAP
jgi:hypothetical protein